MGLITKTWLYNFDPLKPHFCIVKLRFIGVCIIFLNSAHKHRLWALVKTASSRGSNEYQLFMFLAEIWKISEFFIWNFHFLVVKFSVYLNRHVFVMLIQQSRRVLTLVTLALSMESAMIQCKTERIQSGVGIGVRLKPRKIAGWVANSVDPDQTRYARLILVFIVCSGLSAWLRRVNFTIIWSNWSPEIFLNSHL